MGKASQRKRGRKPGGEESAPSPEPRSGSGRLPLVLVLLLAAILRLQFLSAYSRTAFFDQPDVDEGYHHSLAQRLASGEWLLDRQAFHRAPAYYYFLGVVYRIFGPNLYVPRLIQLAGGVLACGLLYLLARRLLPEPVALLAALLLAINPMQVFYESSLLIESTLSWWHLPLLLLLLSPPAPTSWWRLLLAGFFLGMGAISRPNVLLFAPAAMAWVAWQRPGRLLARAGATLWLLLGVALPIAPVTARNVLWTDDWVLISWQGGRELFIGNNAKADGYSAELSDTVVSGRFANPVEATIYVAEQESGRKLTMREVDAHFRRRAWGWITSHPMDALALLGKKLYLYLCGYETPNYRNVYFFQTTGWVMRLLARWPIYVPWGLLFPLAVAGAIASLRDSRREASLLVLFTAIYAGGSLLFHVSEKMRMPVVPVLSLFAAAGLANLWRERRPLPVAALLVLLLVCNSDALGFRSRPFTEVLVHEGLALQKAGRTAEAIAKYREAVALQPSASAWNNLGVLTWLAGKDEEALHAFEMATRVNGFSPDPLFNMAVLHFDKGRHAEGLAYIERAAALAPLDPRMHYGRGWGYALQGKPDLARRELQAYLALEPDATKHAHARELLGGLSR